MSQRVPFSRLLCGIFAAQVLAASVWASPVPANKPSAYPAWWFERNVIVRLNPADSTPTWPSSYGVSDDYAAINQGQLKNIASAAAVELNAYLLWGGGSGTAINDLLASWSAPSASRDDYATVNQGQLKTVAQLFYARLIYEGAVHTYPWTAGTGDDDNYAVANIGQVKQLFSFDLSTFDSRIPGVWKWKIVDADPDDEITSASQVLPDDDYDHDGLSNFQEYDLDLSATNPDTDWDGISDAEEIAANTNPDDSFDRVQKRIAYFPFDDVAFTGAEGQVPMELPGMSPAQPVAGFKGNAMHVDEMGQVLAYDWARPNGAPNFSVYRGSIRMWFKLDWAPAANQMSGHWSRLFDLGLYGSAQVALHFNLDNPILQFFEASESSGHSFTTWSSFADRGVTQGKWHQVVVTYSPTSQKIYLDGSLITNSDRWIDGVPVADGAANWNYPPKLIDFIKQGLKFGSDGYQPLRGAIDEVELFNYELTPTQITQNFGAATTLDSDGDGLPDVLETNGTVNGKRDHPAVNLNFSILVR